MSVHQYARFCEDPKRSHELAVIQVGKYLLGTKDKVIIFNPNHTKCLKFYVDTSFAAGWQQADADYLEIFLSRTGYVIYSADCQILWTSRLQS